MHVFTCFLHIVQENEKHSKIDKLPVNQYVTHFWISIKRVILLIFYINILPIHPNYS
jgi:hypothetical protein